MTLDSLPGHLASAGRALWTGVEVGRRTQVGPELELGEWNKKRQLCWARRYVSAFAFRLHLDQGKQCLELFSLALNEEISVVLRKASAYFTSVFVPLKISMY